MIASHDLSSCSSCLLTVWFATAACCSCVAKDPNWACDQRDDRLGKDSRRMVSLPLLPHFATLTETPPTSSSANVAETYRTHTHSASLPLT